MNSQAYLESFGWTKGEALQAGGISKPILVKHKKDTKGLGNGSDEHEAWWERLFDGQLKGLDVQTGSKGVSFNVEKAKASGVSKNLSPLYRMFVKGGVLEGTVPVTLVKKSKKKEKKSDKVVKNSDKVSKKDKKTKSKSKSKLKSKSKSKSKTDTGEEWIKSLVKNLKQPVTA